MLSLSSKSFYYKYIAIKYIAIKYIAIKYVAIKYIAIKYVATYVEVNVITTLFGDNSLSGLVKLPFPVVVFQQLAGFWWKNRMS